MKTDDLNGLALEWAVVKAHGWEPRICHQGEHPVIFYRRSPDHRWYEAEFATNERWCMNLITEEKIDLEFSGEWQAMYPNKLRGISGFGPTPMIAVYRCYVASQLGEEVELPKELL